MALLVLQKKLQCNECREQAQYRIESIDGDGEAEVDKAGHLTRIIHGVYCEEHKSDFIYYGYINDRNFEYYVFPITYAPQN